METKSRTNLMSFAVPVCQVFAVLAVLVWMRRCTTGSERPDGESNPQNSFIAPSPEQLEEKKRLNDHIIKCLTEAYGLPKKSVEEVLSAAGGVPDKEFRQGLFYKFGVKAPLDWTQLPRWPRAVPIGTTVEYTFKLKPGETSQVFAMMGVWAITIEPTDRSLSMDLDYILDPGQPHGRTVWYRPLPKKQVRYLKPGTTEEVTGAAIHSYQVKLPEGYTIPAYQDSVEFKVVMARVRNPNFNE